MSTGTTLARGADGRAVRARSVGKKTRTFPWSGVTSGGTIAGIALEPGPDTTRHFHEHVRSWRDAIRGVSSSHQIRRNPDFRAIADMGWIVVPLLLRELDHEPRFLIWALEEITGARPYDSGDEGNIARMVLAWREWGRTHGGLEPA